MGMRYLKDIDWARMAVTERLDYLNATTSHRQIDVREDHGPAEYFFIGRRIWRIVCWICEAIEESCI